MAVLVMPRDGALAKAGTLIRDTEIEASIRAFATPLLEAAGLTPTTVRIYIISDDSLNAFVAGGQNIFLNTGLLLRTDNPAQLIGVIAHEIGHVSGGHLPRTADALRSASNTALIGFILGGVTAAVTGSTDAGLAVIQGSSAAARTTFLEYNRSQESAADHAAVTLLDATGQTSRGLAEFLRVLSGEEFLTAKVRSPYTNTHPLTQERISFVENHASRSVFGDAPASADFVRMHQRMLAKLTGFLRSPAETIRRYPETDQSVPARYARTIAAFRASSPDLALTQLDTLIAEYPEDGYFMDLRGQILFESGRLEAARIAYGKALELLDDAPLVQSSLARTELALNTPASNQSARAGLERVVLTMKDSPEIWHQLAIAYGRTGSLGLAALSLAEEALLSGQHVDAVQQAKRALRTLPNGSPGQQRARDIENIVKAFQRPRR